MIFSKSTANYISCSIPPRPTGVRLCLWTTMIHLIQVLTVPLRQVVFFLLKVNQPYFVATPRKINGWNIIPWRFGSDHVPFLIGWFIGSMLIFQGVPPLEKQFKTNCNTGKGTQFFLLHFLRVSWIGEEWSKEMRLAGASLGTFLVYVASSETSGPWECLRLIQGMKYNPVLRNLFFISPSKECRH